MKTATASTILAAALLSVSSHPASGAVAYGLTSTSLLQFDTSAPGTITNTAPISGLAGGDALIDIDFRPADGVLYGMASSGNLYTINPLTGSASLNTSGALGVVQHIDFNPVANRLRVLSAGDHNYRITQGTGLLTDDGVFTFLGTDANASANPNLSAAAYTNSIPGATATTLYSIDSDLDVLISHSVGPQFSTLNTVGPLGIDAGSAVGFDIVTAANAAYLSNGQALYSINLGTGAVTSLGTIGGAGVTSLAVVPEASGALLAVLGSVGLCLRRRRN